ncbi:MAG TPA: aryl-sulfate sulfotransferase, partial [Candidatus Binatia bacterium]|nr:aryl-sulfate sulfotransferase [Candidatus Binatia bacterium]
MNFVKTKKTWLSIAVASTLCIALFLFSPLTYSQTGSNFTLPFTLNTYGSGWNGYLAFDLQISNPLGGSSYYLVVMDTNGNLMDLRNSSSSYGVAYNIAPNTLLFQGEPKVGGAGTAPTYATHIWNMATNTTQDFPNVISHHDIQYDPLNGTFLVLQSYPRDVGNNSYLFDRILQVNVNGTVLWSWDVFDHVPLSQASIFNETTVLNGQTLIDFSHANSLDWDYNNNIIYLNLRCTNTFYKIDRNTGNIVWSVGEFGNFTLLDDQGNQVSSLWYHSHNTKQVAPDVFTMFDNDDNNVTNPNDCRSRMIELTVNETSMTAYVNWSWEAPVQYWNSYAGGTVLLPNGDYLGDFGDPTHQFPQNQPWDFTDTGAVIVEVNSAGEVIKTFTFPTGTYIYRVAAVTDPAFGNFQTPTPTPSPTPVATPTPTPSSTLTP